MFTIPTACSITPPISLLGFDKAVENTILGCSTISKSLLLVLDADRPVLNGQLGLLEKENGTYLSFADQGFVSCAMQFHTVGWTSRVGMTRATTSNKWCQEMFRQKLCLSLPCLTYIHSLRLRLPCRGPGRPCIMGRSSIMKSTARGTIGYFCPQKENRNTIAINLETTCAIWDSLKTPLWESMKTS